MHYSMKQRYEMLQDMYRSTPRLYQEKVREQERKSFEKNQQLLQ